MYLFSSTSDWSENSLETSSFCYFPPVYPFSSCLCILRLINPWDMHKYWSQVETFSTRQVFASVCPTPCEYASNPSPCTVMVSNRTASKIHFVYSLSAQLGVGKTINSLSSFFVIEQICTVSWKNRGSAEEPRLHFTEIKHQVQNKQSNLTL